MALVIIPKCGFCPQHEYVRLLCTAECHEHRLEARRWADALRKYFVKRNRRPPTERSLLCARCRTPFTTVAYQQRFCTRLCQNRVPLKTPRIANCEWCHASFTTVRDAQIFCQALCRHRADRYDRTRTERAARMKRIARWERIARQRQEAQAA